MLNLVKRQWGNLIVPADLKVRKVTKFKSDASVVWKTKPKPKTVPAYKWGSYIKYKIKAWN